MSPKTSARILVVDDNNQNLQLVGSLLSQHGYDVAFSLSGAGVLDTVADIDPDLILLDIMMPGMDGYQVCKSIKLIKGLEDLPIIFLTAKTRLKDLTTGFEKGAVDYVFKPFNSKELLARVKTHVELKKIKEKIKNDAKIINRLNRDLSRKNADLVNINRTMDSIIKKKTDQLQNANHTLQTLNDEKMDFIRFISHEINTPLNFISATQAIDKKELSENNIGLLDMVDHGFSRINRFLKAVVNYFEFAGDMPEIKPEFLSLKQILLDAIKKISDAPNVQPIEFRVNCQEDFHLEADRYYLTELTTILFKNAAAFSNPDQTVDIEALMEDKRPVLKICDKGKGIPPKNLDIIFKPFLIPEFERLESGFALSLPKAKIIADTCGWHLSAQSAGPGKGACFKIKFLSG